MRFNRTILTTILLCAGFGALSAQASLYISRLKVFEEDDAIKLTWKDPRNTRGTIHVFRHFEEITADNFEEAYEAGITDIGTEAFNDLPPTDINIYYAVLVQPEGEVLHTVFINQRNKTSNPVQLHDTTPETELAAIITQLNAQVTGDSVVLRFNSDKNDRDLIIYRGIEPIFTISGLVNATSLKIIKSGIRQFKDYPVEGIPYYYAVLDAGLVKIGAITFTPDENTLKNPVSLPIDIQNGSSRYSSSIRSRPLPELILNEEIESGNRLTSSLTQILPKYRKLSPEALAAVDAVMETRKNSAPEPLQPVILAPDRVSTGRGEDYILHQILDGPFQEQDWEQTETELREFLRLRAFSSIEHRTRFYLGQALYFQSDYRAAFMELLIAQDTFYTDVTPWLEDILLRLNP